MKLSKDKVESVKLAMFALKTKSPEQKNKNVLEPVAKEFGYKNWRVVYTNLMNAMDAHPEFKRWWKQNNRHASRKPKSTVK